MLKVITREVLDGFSEFSGEEFLVGAHTEKDVLAKAKHARVNIEVGSFNTQITLQLPISYLYKR